MADISKLMLENFMPYAKGTIIDRAIPYIDGFKPVNRRILYAMYELRLWDRKAKSNRIVGDTMGKYHPHGDSSIYDALVRMTDSNEASNHSLVVGKGNFGKVWSDEITPAHMRYTEAGLAPIAREIFEGISEDAVDMLENFDNTEKEPNMLPVKYPNVLVNTSNGIAVGMGSSIPSYNLKDVCLATIAMLQGKATKPSDLVSILGAPDFTTGGFIHVSDADILKLLKKGSATLTISGSVQLKKDAIIVNYLPYNTTMDKFVAQVEAQAGKDGEIREISNVTDRTGLKGMSCEINIKRGYDVRDVLKKLYRLTDLRKKISFNTRIIVDDKPMELGVYELLDLWIDFRVKTVKRIYNHRLGKATDREHLLKAWELMKDDVTAVAIMVSSNTEEVAKEILISKYGMDDLQADYILDMKVKQLTTDNMLKRLSDLEAIRKDIEDTTEFIGNEVEIRNYIVGELEGIIKKYGHDRITKVMEPVIEPANGKEEVIIPDMDVWVLMTEKGFLKRVVNPMDTMKADAWLSDGDKVIREIKCRNTESILVVTYGGFCYKIPVHSIESSRSAFRDYVWDLADKKEDSDICYVTNSGDYNKYFNVIYGHGSGRKVYLGAVSGPRSRYQGLFKAGTKEDTFVTECDEFFIITYKRKAAYANLKILNMYSARSAFKIARVGSDDTIFGIQPVENVPDMSVINKERFNKGYCVSIKDDVLWKRN